ncbi:lysylphosphatidylglycerol synthase transmembrane domain-containing protein [Vibrio diazotrophicus]|uniref:lysylphosphatidylglycerol synthase transmembrane domain-containing protein n=1 Tax=Vibrio diazotrophicus TaxID=685 RepID=UPI0022AF3C49|nr:lysylphosphatidylglycerol synthase transmembrane domain-containing protein [Vibrio diazotrophicus]MCZ4372667.1 lysylphosphatidylglycerol synthase transmembrane domain-containing protein [Vibrio diazotrophicus]
MRHLRRVYLWLALFFVLYMFWKHSSDVKSALQYLQAMPVNIVIGGLVLAVFSYNLRALRWLQYMHLKQNSASIKYHILIYFSGFAFTATPGKAGELVRGTYLADIGIPFRYTFCAFVSERLLDVIAVSLLGTYFLTRHYSVFFASITVSIVCFLFLAPFILEFAMRIIKRRTLLDITTTIKMLWIFNVVVKNTFYSLLCWSSQGIILYLVLIELDADISAGMAISIYCLSLLFGAVSLIPSGIGVTEIGMVWLLMQNGVDQDVAVVSSLIARMMTLWPAMSLGLVSALTLKVMKIKSVSEIIR